MSEYVNLTPGPLTYFHLDIESGASVTHENLTQIAGGPSVDVEYSDTPETLASEHNSNVTAVDRGDPQAEPWSARLIDCVTSHYGLPVIAGVVGAGGAYAGGTLPKAGNVRAPGAMGASPNMTRLSFYTHRIERTVPPAQRTIHQRFLTHRMTGVTGQTARAMTGTRVVGRFIGRFCGPLGWVMLAADAAMIANCVTGADAWLRQQWQNTVEDMIQEQDVMEQYFIRGIATGRWVF